MVSDQEIAEGVETVLRQSGPNDVTSVNGVVQQLEAKLGLDLSHKAGFIRDQINFLLRPFPQPQPPPKDHFALHPNPTPTTTTLNSLPQLSFPNNFLPILPSTPTPVPLLRPTASRRNLSNSGLRFSRSRQLPSLRSSPRMPQLSPQKRPKRVLRLLEPREGALPRTEIVKQLWAYIRKNNLQDPSNKRKIICDDALRVVFETDCTDMFKMNKLLSKHIITLGPKKEPSQAKRVKLDVESATDTDNTQSGSSTIIISEALAKFLGLEGREMLKSEAIRLVWEYVKANNLEDPVNSMVILCDPKLHELLGCESISALGVQEMLDRYHFFKQS
ncbi:hypothetical protein M0R45_012777 [Rubus argutus]|uniref:Uncharacterized protein n=1 Tax=Rubus argutus TaxID=59490 RepID=A0AAW1XHJ8_RUBAR